MQDNEITIKVSRIIPAEKRRTFRMLTKVWEFPSFIPTVKKVSVIHKNHNVITTSWEIQVDSIPIKWTEEDRIDLDANTIEFRAIEGDLESFQGKWTFNDHPEGNEVNVTINLKIDIPGIKEFAENYIKTVVTRNFEAILEYLEKRLVSLRYHHHKQGETSTDIYEKIAGFGIIGHLYNFYHLEKNLKMLRPDFKMPSREFLGKLFHLTPSFKLFDIKNFRSKTNEAVNGCFILATFIPDMIDKDIWSVFSKVIRACKIAEKNGLGIVTLGGFTSIIAEQTEHEISNEVDIAVTTGNTFTAAITIQGIYKAARLLDIDLKETKLTIVGGTGDIGSACGRVLVNKVKELTLTGRTKSHLRKLGAELSKRKKAKITVTTDNRSAVRDADIVIAAASATSSILNIDWFKPGSVICDIGYPKNISYSPTERKDILIFSGGLSKPPTPFVIPFDIGLPSQDALYGCFAEAIILALEKRYENFSFGRGNITPEKIEEIGQMGEKHGFEVADFYWGEKTVDVPLLNRIKESIRK